MKIGKKNLDQSKFASFDGIPRMSPEGVLLDHSIKALANDYANGEIIWDEENNSIWNLSLETYSPAYLHFICNLIDVLWSFVAYLNQSGDGLLYASREGHCENKYYFGFAYYDFIFGDAPGMVLINNIYVDPDDRYIGIFPDTADLAFPKVSKARTKVDLNLLNEPCSLFDECKQQFESIYEQRESEGYTTNQKEFYKYKPEVLAVKVLKCFEENFRDIPLDSSVLYCNDMQTITGKASQLRDYLEKKALIKPLPNYREKDGSIKIISDVYCPKFKIVPIDEEDRKYLI